MRVPFHGRENLQTIRLRCRNWPAPLFCDGFTAVMSILFTAGGIYFNVSTHTKKGKRGFFMKYEFQIETITGREILDSRGNPTVSAEVRLKMGFQRLRAFRPALQPACLKRANCATATKSVTKGKGVQNAVSMLTKLPAPLPESACWTSRGTTRLCLDLDGTENKKALGANAILAVSLAMAKAGAKAVGLPLYRYLGGVSADTLPVPMMNILNGGAHAKNNI